MNFNQYQKKLIEKATKGKYISDEVKDAIAKNITYVQGDGKINLFDWATRMYTLINPKEEEKK